jgi:hypothetical protein
MAATYFSETSMDFHHRSTRRYIPEGTALRNDRFENLRSPTVALYDSFKEFLNMSYVLYRRGPM